jgi:RNA polymerase sigma factor (sigma-70 family)
LSAQKDINSHLKVLRSDNQQDMLVLFLNNLPQLQMYAFSYLNNLTEAEDVTASVIEKLILVKVENDSGFNSLSDTELVGYLKVTIRNACIDLLRKRKVRRSAMTIIGASIQFWKRPEVYDKFQLEAFDMLLLELSPREREILELHLQGLKNDDISEQLGLSALTVRNTLHNAKKRVRKLWNIFMR